MNQKSLHEEKTRFRIVRIIIELARKMHTLCLTSYTPDSWSNYIFVMLFRNRRLIRR